MEQRTVQSKKFLQEGSCTNRRDGDGDTVWRRIICLAFQQRQGGDGAPQGGRRGGAQVAIPDIPGPVPTLKLGGIEVSD